MARAADVGGERDGGHNVRRGERGRSRKRKRLIVIVGT
jgi:hypothetical protein